MPRALLLLSLLSCASPSDDPLVGDPCTPSTHYADADGDGYGDVLTEQHSCPEPDRVDRAEDCDDTDDQVHPGAVERCNGWDDDCDQVADEEAPDAPIWYADSDGDGFGDPYAPTKACDAPAEHVADDTDCDDGDDGVFPGAEEVCNGIDDDCDGTEDIGATDAVTWYADLDGDGFGDPDASEPRCDTPSEGYSLNADDCDDGDREVNPDAFEVCDGVDTDCDPSTSEDGTITVNGSASLHYTNLDDALAVVASHGAVMRVCAGTWSTSIPLQKNITIEGPHGSALTIIEAPKADAPVFRLTSSDGRSGPEVMLEGLTLTGATQGAVWLEDARSLRLVDCDVLDSGAGFDIEAGEVVMEGGGVLGHDVGVELHGGSFEAVGVDFERGSLSNLVDVEVGSTSYDYGAAASAVCSADSGACK